MSGYMNNKNKTSFFDIDNNWVKEWIGMPEFIQEDLPPFKTINLNFKNEKDVNEFAKLINQKITKKTKFIWHPKGERKNLLALNYTEKKLNPKYPIYIVSKGRWESRLTVKALEKMNIPYYIIIENQEYKQYLQVINKKNILILDQQYQKDYDTCDNLGDSKSKGPGAARNFAWDHSIANNFKWHWVMDDNIGVFYRLNKNLKIRVYSGTCFRIMEDFCERYLNVLMAGPNYELFIPRKRKHPPFITNTRIYSCNLIRNDIPFRWRGRYNEDTDLSLRILKAGYCTIQFNAFLQDKVSTQLIKGGNTKEFYEKEGTLPKSQMQVDLHPDVSRLVWKFNRWHHHVDYRKFKSNKLIKKEDIFIPKGINNYGMKLEKK